MRRRGAPEASVTGVLPSLMASRSRHREMEWLLRMTITVAAYTACVPRRDLWPRAATAGRSMPWAPRCSKAATASPWDDGREKLDIVPIDGPKDKEADTD